MTSKPRKARVKPDAPADPPAVLMNIVVHPDLRAELKAAAAHEQLNMPEKLHEILCREFERPDLVDQAPRTSRPTTS